MIKKSKKENVFFFININFRYRFFLYILLFLFIFICFYFFIYIDCFALEHVKVEQVPLERPSSNIIRPLIPGSNIPSPKIPAPEQVDLHKAQYKLT